jgi:hypothetical protein
MGVQAGVVTGDLLFCLKIGFEQKTVCSQQRAISI